MLTHLSIRDFVLIERLDLEFGSGFTVLTGETGAGKSIIIDALGLLTGERASASMVRFGSTKAFIQGVFELKRPLADSILDYTLGDNVLIITKEIDSSGKSISKINGRLTNIAMIKEITSSIIDIHNQNENLYLLDSRSQGNLLDNFILIDKNKDY